MSLDVEVADNSPSPRQGVSAKLGLGMADECGERFDALGHAVPAPFESVSVRPGAPTVPKARAIIQLTMTRLVVARCRGDRVEDARAHELDAPTYKDRWPGIIAELHEPLTGLVRSLGLSGADAVLLYHAPTAIAGVYNCPATGSISEARSAARLQAAESLSTTDGISDAQALATDPSPVNARGAPQRHTLAVLDAAQSVDALTSWLTSAGLNVMQCLPVDAPALALCVRNVTATSGQKDPATATATIWIGEHSTTMAAGVGGTLRFIRTVAIGTEALCEAMSRPMRTRRPDEVPITLDRPAARALLAKAGIPLPGDVIDSSRGIDGASVLPLLQPVLQRLAVEVKQSFRFGLTEGERTNLRIVLDGPGSALGRLAESVAQLTGLSISSERALGSMIGLSPTPGVQPIPSPAQAPAPQDSSNARVAERVSSIITAWPGLRGLGLGLVSDQTRQAQRILGARRGLRLGYLSAGALLCMSWFWTSVQLSQSRSIFEDLQRSAGDADRLAQMKTSLAEATQLMRALESRVARHASPTSDFAVLLAEVASATPPHVRISRVEIAPGERNATLRLTGRISAAAERPFAQAMRSYTDTLGAIPLVLDARLGATSRVPASEAVTGEEHRFELSLSLAPLTGLNVTGITSGQERARAIAEERP
jgi:hypothetical protein